jgi:hypothetical protein
VTKLQARPERAVFGVEERSAPATVDEGVQTNKMIDVATQTDLPQEAPAEMVAAMSITTGDIGDFADLPNQTMPGTPVYKLEQEYARCMRVSMEELDLPSISRKAVNSWHNYGTSWRCCPS